MALMGSHILLMNVKPTLFFRNVRFGSLASPVVSDLLSGPLRFPLTHIEKNVIVEVSGSLPVLWKNSKNQQCETLVITNSDEPSIIHILPSFLFYIAASTGVDDSLTHLMGSGSFTVFVSYRKGIKSFTYNCNSKESLDYITRILNDFLDETTFDLLPCLLYMIIPIFTLLT